MNLPSFSKASSLVRVAKNFVVGRRSELLLGTSIAATLSSVVLAARGGYKSGYEIADAEATAGCTLTTKEKAILTWQNYIPAAAGTVVAIGSTTALHLVHIADKKALAQTAMIAAEEGKKIIEDFAGGEEATEDILEADEDDNGVIKVRDEDGVIVDKYLVRDAWTGRDIFATEQEIADGINWANHRLNDDGDVSLNDVYAYLGYDEIAEGTEFGWSGGRIDISWGLDKRTDGRPVRVFSFRPTPEKDYTNRR